MMQTYRCVRSAGVDGVSKSELTWKLRAFNRRTREEYLQDLIESGRVVSGVVKTKGRPRVVYVSAEFCKEDKEVMIENSVDFAKEDKEAQA